MVLIWLLKAIKVCFNVARGGEKTWLNDSINLIPSLTCLLPKMCLYTINLFLGVMLPTTSVPRIKCIQIELSFQANSPVPSWGKPTTIHTILTYNWPILDIPGMY